MKIILGLDLGTNSIGWALVEKPENETENGKILGMGSRIISVGDDKTNFEQGLALTRNADRRRYRGARKLNKRYKQRRNKLIYVLNVLGMLPDFIKWEGELPESNKIQQLSIKPISKNSTQFKALELFELRKNAIFDKVELKDFGRILYLLNQLRGYAGGGEDEEKDKRNYKEEKEEEEESIKKYEVKVETVKIKTAPNEIGKVKSKKKKDDGKEIPEFEVMVETSDGEEYTGTTTLDILKINEEIELSITIRRNKKTGENTSVIFSLPKKTNWRIEFEKLEKEFKDKGEPNISELFYDKLKENPWCRIRNNVIQRHRYKKEFDAIWDKQVNEYELLSNTPKEILEKIANYLFPGNSGSQTKYREEALKNGLKYIIKEQIIYYQRPLKSQIKLISNCSFEKLLKVIPQSHPLYQEFRIWKQINNLSVNTVTEIDNKKHYYDKTLSSEQKTLLYELLQEQKELSHNSIRSKLKLRDKIDYLNGIHVKAKLKGNETQITIKKLIGDGLFNKLGLDNNDNLTKFWRILYNWLKDDNINFDSKDYEKEPDKYQAYNPNSDNEYDLNSERFKSIKEFVTNQLREGTENTISNDLLLKIAKLRFKRSYGAFSAKAINNILPLMKAGKYYDKTIIKPEIKTKIEKIINGEENTSIDNSLREHYIEYPECFNGTGLMDSFAVMLIYGKHTAEEFKGIDDYHQIKTYEQLKKEDPENADKYTLRNPIVEQITNETLQVIKSIWKQYKIKPDEIRVELARELKNSAEERNKIYIAVQKNERENKYIKERLVEMHVESTNRNIEKYKLWKQQVFVSPYTGDPIPINDNNGLFSETYQVDHIIPRSRFFDDSLTNKVVCETNVNNDKGNKTAWEYILSGSTEQKLLKQDNYMQHVNKIFWGRKRKNLLLTEIPKDFIERQMKDTQYISIKVKEELGKIIGTANVKTTTGGITDYLRQHWGLNEIFKEITKQRYELMGKMCGENWVEYFTDKKTEKKYLKIKNWSKRYDHRHHAIDALVVACTEQSHIQRLNNLNKELQKWLIEHKEEVKNNFVGSDEELLDVFLNLSKEKREKIVERMPSFRQFIIPWENLGEEVQKHFETMVISHKPKQKLLIQKDKNGQEMLRIRGSLHEETYYGKNDTYRLPLSKLFGKKDILKFVNGKVVSKAIAEALKEHLKKFKDVKDAFSDMGITEFNKNRIHRIKAIKVRYAKESKKESKLQPLNKKYYPENSILIKTGGNYCFAIAGKDKIRKYGIISFYDAANLVNESMKEGNKNIAEIIGSYFQNTHETTKGYKLLFTLSQDDLVYLPSFDEEYIPLKESEEIFKKYWDSIDRKRIFRVVKFTGNFCYFTSHVISQGIIYKTIKETNTESNTGPITYSEFGSNNGCCPYIYLDSSFFHQNNQLNMNLSENTKVSTIPIQDTCIKISVDRLGNIKPAYD